MFRPENPSVACIGRVARGTGISRTNAGFAFIGRCIPMIARSRGICRGLKNDGSAHICSDAAHSAFDALHVSA